MVQTPKTDKSALMSGRSIVLAKGTNELCRFGSDESLSDLCSVCEENNFGHATRKPRRAAGGRARVTAVSKRERPGDRGLAVEPWGISRTRLESPTSDIKIVTMPVFLSSVAAGQPNKTAEANGTVVKRIHTTLKSRPSRENHKSKGLSFGRNFIRLFFWHLYNGPNGRIGHMIS